MKNEMKLLETRRIWNWFLWL